MARENVRKFEDMVREDASLRDRIKNDAEAYKGDADNERAYFDAIIAPIAAEIGVPFTFDEVVEEMDMMGELDEAELAAVAGGKGGCFVFGYSTKPEYVDDGTDVHFCCFIGMGMMELPNIL